MPKSRHRKRKHKTASHGPAVLPSFQDVIRRMLERSFAEPPAPVYYHYTKWEGAAGILNSQRFWATAHDCTNDPGELVAADETILGIATSLELKSSGLPRIVLNRFISDYPKQKVAAIVPTYLTCFSMSRDDPNQWEKYADGGKGICLGLRVLKENLPNNPNWTVMSMKVDYSEESWTQKLQKDLAGVCRLLARPNVALSDENVNWGVHTLIWITAAYALSAKKDAWAREQETTHGHFDPTDIRFRSSDEESTAR